MKIFISWSGDVSLQIAKILRDWIPNVIQAAKPYVSAEDIDKGTRWATDISQELDDSSYGIICLTKNNISAPWINFEAGALGKQVDKSRVSPFLFKIKPSEVSGPIIQFQQTRADSKEDIYKLISSINKHSGALSEERLKKSFEQWWPNLDTELSSIEIVDSEPVDSTKAPDGYSEIKEMSEIVENLLDISRTNHQLLRNPESLLPEEYVSRILSRNDLIKRDLRAVTTDIKESLDKIERIRRKVIRSKKANDDVANDDFINDLVDMFRELEDELSKPVKYMEREFGINSSRPRLLRSKQGMSSSFRALIDDIDIDDFLPPSV
ncbi:toll/interleukin-1 receptor domain-containing protein [Proteus faecis]|uniref:toll/interleukin-1 receptor domain-containing protein n=1 Tax=Proteus faecis TaxID=2050967 RepID=UPI0020BEDFA6